MFSAARVPVVIALIEGIKNDLASRSKDYFKEYRQTMELLAALEEEILRETPMEKEFPLLKQRGSQLHHE